MRWLSEDCPWRDRIALAVLTVLTLLAFWSALPSQFQTNQNFDYHCCYQVVAHNWIDGKGFILSNGTFAARYPPGFSVTLAGMFLVGRWIGEDLAVRILIVICGVASVLALYASGRSIGDAWTGRIAGLCLITYPFFLWLFKQPNSELLFLPFVLWGFYGYLRLAAEPTGNSPWKWAAFAGLCWGLSTLVRPISLLLPFAIGACLILFCRNRNLGRRVLLAAVLVATFVVTIFPWELVARRELGRWILIANDDNSFLEGMTFALPGGMQANPAPIDPDIFAMMHRAAANPQRLRSIGGFLNFMKDEYQANAGTVVKLVYLKATRTWYATHEGYFETANMVIQFIYLVICGVGLWWMRRSKSAEAMGILTVLACFWFMTILVVPLLRYMVPPTAVMLLAMAFAVQKLAKRLY